MNFETSEIENHLKSIKRWIVVRAIGFLITGLGVLIFSVTMYKAISHFDSEFSERGNGPDASGFSRANISRLIEKGKIDDAMNTIMDRLDTHPNDPVAHWLKARVHMIEEDWEAALKHVNKAELLAPSWKEEYTGPMREKIERASN